MQLVVHCPYGARINRAFGLALRKRFCVTFDFELQAAANDDALVLSLGPQHSFPLEDVARFLRAATVEEVLHQAILVPPFAMFTSRWRWNLNRSLDRPPLEGRAAEPPGHPAHGGRRRDGRRVPRGRRLPGERRPGPSRCPTTPSSARPCTTR